MKSSGPFHPTGLQGYKTRIEKDNDFRKAEMVVLQPQYDGFLFFSYCSINKLASFSE